MSDKGALDSCYGGFRQRYLDYAELSQQLQAWSRTFPEICRLTSLTKTPEDRELWLLTIGPDPDRTRPSVWVDGNLHASELCGSSVALGIAEDVLRLHLEPDQPLHGLSASLREALREIVFFVAPRISPDGAEAVLKSGRWLRSVPRDERLESERPHWISGDVDGDGLALLMRQPDPTGEFVESEEAPGLMLRRRLEDERTPYKLYPEGSIAGFDGEEIPDPHYLSDNSPDLNRNFPYAWAPEPEQAGAGPFPASEPESRALLEFATHTPQLFAWLNLHTFGGVFIRPLGHKPDEQMDPGDLAVFRQIAEWGERFTGYPTVSGFHEFTYVPDKPLHGDLSDFAYHHRGALAYVCELWDLFTQLSLPRPKRFVEYYTSLSSENLLALHRWDRENNAGRIYQPWRSFDHPQLGEVEIGGFDPRVGIWNPPYERIDGVARGQSAAFLRVAALCPRIQLELECEALGGDLHRVTARVENHGYLADYGVPSARNLPHSLPLSAELFADAVALVHAQSARQELGHLEGWGRGLNGSDSALHVPRSRGSVGKRRVHWLLRGAGSVRVRVGSPRVGYSERVLRIRASG